MLNLTSKTTNILKNAFTLAILKLTVSSGRHKDVLEELLWVSIELVITCWRELELRGLLGMKMIIGV